MKDTRHAYGHRASFHALKALQCLFWTHHLSLRAPTAHNNHPFYILFTFSYSFLSPPFLSLSSKCLFCLLFFIKRILITQFLGIQCSLVESKVGCMLCTERIERVLEIRVHWRESLGRRDKGGMCINLAGGKWSGRNNEGEVGGDLVGKALDCQARISLCRQWKTVCGFQIWTCAKEWFGKINMLKYKFCCSKRDQQ